MCGGTIICTWLKISGSGLSPRVRGNPTNTQIMSKATGSIPACAGEPVHASQQASGYPVYPRVCGGTPELEHRHRCHEGLSPRVRGNPDPQGV